MAQAPLPPQSPVAGTPLTTPRSEAIEPGTERVDFLVDSDGSVIDTPEDQSPEVEEEIERAVEATSPSGWFGWGIFALGVIIIILGLAQAFSRATTG